MKNKELLNICHKFLNRFINSDELIEELNNIDKKEMSKEEIKKLDKLIMDIKEIIANIPNKIDEYVIGKKKKVNNLIDKFETIPKDEDIINRLLNNLKKDNEKEIDSHERWLAIAQCIDENDYFNTCFDNLSDNELLEFISQYIQVPFPPQLSQEKFEKLVKVGIENDEREWLWRLALNYERRNINFDLIVDYFIKVKDGYYLAELISAVGECLDIDSIIGKINDKELIKDLKERKYVICNYVSEEQFNKLVSKLD